MAASRKASRRRSARIVYDAETGQLASGSFMDYMIPRDDLRT